MKTLLMGREIPLRGPDARIRLDDAHPAFSDYFRLEGMLLVPDDALAYLRDDCGFLIAEARRYLELLPTVTV